MQWAFKLAHPKLLYENATFLSLGFTLPSVLQILLYFILLGICASDYLCPSIANLSGSVETGSSGALTAVLLSWCNSSPDLFSNFMSWTNRSENGDTSNKNSAALSVGEVLGACGIILCVVEGSIFMIMSFVDLNITNAQRKTILKDLGFTTISMLLMWYICLMNRVTVLNCVTMIVVYLSYLASKFLFKSSPPRYHEDEEFNLELSTQSTESGIDPFTGHIRPNIITAMDFNNLLYILESSTKEEQQRQLLNLESALENNQNINDILDLPSRANTEPTPYTRFSDIPNPPSSSPSTFQPYHDNLEQNILDSSTFPAFNMTRRSNKTRIISKYKKHFFRLFLPHLINFSQKSRIDAVLSIITTPFVIILRISCPQPLKIIDYDLESKKYIFSNIDFIILFSQALLSPIFSFFILSCIMSKEFSLFIWTIPILLSSLFLFLTLIYYRTILSYNKFSLFSPTPSTTDFTTDIYDDRRTVEKFSEVIKLLFLSECIINSILWISLIANALIEILEIYQHITGISEAILGLTIFAWGNSVSDLLSNIAMCKLYKQHPTTDSTSTIDLATKFFIISCSSCVGSVLLNSMCGIGISGLFSMIFIHKDSHKYWFLRKVVLNETDDEFDVKFIISCIALLLQVFLLSVTFSGPEIITERLQKNKFELGLGMCCLWGLPTVINIILESVSK